MRVAFAPPFLCCKIGRLFLFTIPATVYNISLRIGAFPFPSLLLPFFEGLCHDDKNEDILFQGHPLDPVEITPRGRTLRTRRCRLRLAFVARYVGAIPEFSISLARQSILVRPHHKLNNPICGVGLQTRHPLQENPQGTSGASLSLWWRRRELHPCPARLRSTSSNSTAIVLQPRPKVNNYFGAPGRIRTRNSVLRRDSPVRLAGAFWSDGRDSNSRFPD